MWWRSDEVVKSISHLTLGKESLPHRLTPEMLSLLQKSKKCYRWLGWMKGLLRYLLGTKIFSSNRSGKKRVRNKCRFLLPLLHCLIKYKLRKIQGEGRLLLISIVHVHYTIRAPRAGQPTLPCWGGEGLTIMRGGALDHHGWVRAGWWQQTLRS